MKDMSCKNHGLAVSRPFVQWMTFISDIYNLERAECRNFNHMTRVRYRLIMVSGTNWKEERNEKLEN